MAIRKSEDIAATGPSLNPLLITRGWLRLSGTWVGTVNLQTDPLGDDGWTDVTDQTGAVIALTQNCNCPIDNSIPTKTRVNWTRTSGTLNVLLAGEPNRR